VAHSLVQPSTAARRPAVIAMSVGLGLGLSACGGSDVTFGDATAAGSKPPAASSAPASEPAGGDADFVLPALPSIVVPDVTAFTERSQQYAEKLGGVVNPTSGVRVTGARCDPKGRVVNTPSLTFTDNGDGSGVYTDSGKTVVNNGDGSGEYVDAGKTIVINKDGSGQYVDAGVTINIDKDGSGEYVDAGKTVTVNGDGSGEYVDTEMTITVHADGSGEYVDSAMTVTVKVDGSGEYVDAGRTVISNGDGTGIIDGEAAKVAPFPRFAPVGSFPPVKSLKPLGRSCGTLIRLDERVLFDFDKAELRPAAGPVLDAVAKSLTGVTADLQVNGHTDAIGSDGYNLDLSQRRAKAVADALTERGVGAELVVNGFGETQPIVANQVNGKDNPGGRQLNRRVEIVIPD
jgi:OOP family OmpA-OmpF porin